MKGFCYMVNLEIDNDNNIVKLEHDLIFPYDLSECLATAIDQIIYNEFVKGKNLSLSDQEKILRGYRTKTAELMMLIDYDYIFKKMSL